jgi:hypothetical protein
VLYALALLRRLTRCPIELEALDLEPPGALWLRLSGQARTLATRCERLERFVDGHTERLDGEDDERAWVAAREFAWVPSDATIAKVALTLARLPALDAELAAAGATRRYSRAGTLGWIGWPSERPTAELDVLLRRLGSAGCF